MRELARFTGIAASAVLLLACSQPASETVAAGAPAEVAPADTAAPVAATSVAAAAGAPIAEAPAAPVSSDPDAPIALPALELKGSGSGKSETRYYDFDAGAGQVTVTATAKNAPSGSTQALIFGLYDTQANRICYDMHGNTTDDKTVELKCQIEKPQRVLLRLDLSPESLDHTIVLNGPVTLRTPTEAAAAGNVAGAGSTDVDAPTRLKTNRVKADGTGKPVSYYYAFNAGPGELTLTGDGSNTSAAVTEALRLGLYTLRSEQLCELGLGNTTLEKRAVTTCVLDKRQPVILRADLSAETVGFRARFDGPHDFEDFTPPKVITIALDSSVLFDTGKSAIKPEARQQLHEAAERVKKFAGASVLVSGHTDNVGTASSNQILSTARAEAVQAHLVKEEGIAAATLVTKGYGSTQPVDDNGTEAGRARNRRVDIVITPKGS